MWLMTVHLCCKPNCPLEGQMNKVMMMSFNSCCRPRSLSEFYGGLWRTVRSGGSCEQRALLDSGPSSRSSLWERTMEMGAHPPSKPGFHRNKLQPWGHLVGIISKGEHHLRSHDAGSCVEVDQKQDEGRRPGRRKYLLLPACLQSFSLFVRRDSVWTPFLPSTDPCWCLVSLWIIDVADWERWSLSAGLWCAAETSVQTDTCEGCW